MFQGILNGFVIGAIAMLFQEKKIAKARQIMWNI